MATNKNSLIRYKILDQCFRNPGRRYFIEDLIMVCSEMLLEINPSSGGVSRRQIFDDIRFMESTEGWAADIERLKDGKRVFYRYKDISFSINNMPLNEMEINYILNALEILDQFKGLPQFDLLQDLIPKIRTRTFQPATKMLVGFDSNRFLKGIDFVGSIYNAIQYRKALQISYQPFDAEQGMEVEFHPYVLKQYNNRWFAFGYNPSNDRSDWNLALDRINAICETSSTYVENNVIDWEEYFEDIIGVTKPFGTSPQKVVVEFYGISGKYIVNKPIHGSQKSKWLEDEVLQVEILVHLNYELESLLLSYCDSLKIISPVELKEKLKQRLSKAISLAEQ